MVTASNVLKALKQRADINKKIEELERRKRDRVSGVLRKPVKFYVLEYSGTIPTEGTFSGRTIAYYGHKKKRDAAFKRYKTCMARFGNSDYLDLVKKKTDRTETIAQMTERVFRARMDVELQNKFVEDFMTMAFRSAPPTTPCFYLFVETDKSMRDMAGLWEDETRLAESAVVTALAKYELPCRITIKEIRPRDIPCYELRPYICKDRDIVGEADALAASMYMETNEKAIKL
jgi:hypothetical protein